MQVADGKAWGEVCVDLLLIRSWKLVEIVTKEWTTTILGIAMYYLYSAWKWCDYKLSNIRPKLKASCCRLLLPHLTIYTHKIYSVSGLQMGTDKSRSLFILCSVYKTYFIYIPQSFKIWHYLSNIHSDTVVQSGPMLVLERYLAIGSIAFTIFAPIWCLSSINILKRNTKVQSILYAY